MYVVECLLVLNNLGISFKITFQQPEKAVSCKPKKEQKGDDFASSFGAGGSPFAAASASEIEHPSFPCGACAFVLKSLRPSLVWHRQQNRKALVSHRPQQDAQKGVAVAGALAVAVVVPWL